MPEEAGAGREEVIPNTTATEDVAGPAQLGTMNTKTAHTYNIFNFVYSREI